MMLMQKKASWSYDGHDFLYPAEQQFEASAARRLQGCKDSCGTTNAASLLTRLQMVVIIQEQRRPDEWKWCSFSQDCNR